MSSWLVNPMLVSEMTSNRVSMLLKSLIKLQLYVFIRIADVS